MRMLDRDIHECRALVVDCNATSRSILVAQLRDFGVGTVAQCGRIADARVQLEARQFDVVLCEHGFHGTEYSGQQLLDDLRRHQLLPLSTVFVMITSESSYAKVAEAAESALDGYLLKPHTAAALGERIRQARRRKKVLHDIFQGIDEGRFEDAAKHCVARLKARAEYWLYAARIGAELMLHLGRHDEARSLYDAVLQTQALPWARLGIARTHVEANDLGTASHTLEMLIAEQPGFVDAYDVMGRVHVEQGNLEHAAGVYRQAAALTPGSVSRQQKLGMLAFYLGDREEAARALDRAVTLGISSKMFDFQTLVLLAFTRFHAGDTKGLQRCADNLAHALSRAPDNQRLIRFAQVVHVLNLMLYKQVAEAVQAIRDLAKTTREPSFDFEAASNMVSLISQLTAGELKLDRVEEWIDEIGLRHCASH
jgi:CheY-like chemotaxis protein